MADRTTEVGATRILTTRGKWYSVIGTKKHAYTIQDGALVKDIFSFEVKEV